MKTVYITAPNKIPCSDGDVVEGMVFREVDTLLLWTTISYKKKDTLQQSKVLCNRIVDFIKWSSNAISLYYGMKAIKISYTTR